MKKGYYKADVVYGVYYYGDCLEDENEEVLRPIDFYTYLTRLHDDEQITTFMDEYDIDIYNKIDNEYGVE